MERRVRVRKARPGALPWALALVAAVLAVSLAVLPGREPEVRTELASGRVAVVGEVTLEGVEIYLIALCGYDSEGDARIAAAPLAQRGAAGCLRRDGDGWQVLLAGYATREEAAEETARLKEEAVEATVVVLRTAPVHLRITGREANTRALQEALEWLERYPEQAAVMAAQLDRGELSDASARILAAAARTEALTHARYLNAEGLTQNPVCAALAAQLERLAEGLRTVESAMETGAALSGRLRACHVESVLARVDFMEQLRARGA